MMSTRINILSSLVLLSCLFMLCVPAVIQADYDYSYYSDRLSREHRAGNDVDEWIERGNATINASPHFDEGARLTAWASKYIQEDDYEFAIASAVYFFEIPPQAQYIEILVRFRGEPHEPYIEDYESIAGRIWIRNTRREYTRRGYDDKHADETRYGDTFVLRAKRRSETIKIPAAGHVDNGFLEMHVVAQDGEQLDIEYIDVSTHRKQRHIHRYHRYARSYQWRPWHHYTYLYFYDGPCYYATDHNYYIRWSYPMYDRHYFAVRYSYGNYLHRYYTYYPTYYYRSYSSPRYVHVGPKSLSKKRQTRLNQWSQEHEKVRRQYSRSRLSVARKTTKQVNIQPRVRSVIEKHRAQQPVLTDQAERSSTIARKRERTGYQTRSNALVRERGNALRSYRSSSTKPSSTSQSNRRFNSRGSTVDNVKKNSRIRSNAERRSQLYNRSNSYSGRSRASSPSESNIRSSSKRKRSEASVPSRPRSTKSSSSSPPSRSRVSAAPSRQSSSASSSDDEDQENRSSNRTRNTERTSRRRKR